MIATGRTAGEAERARDGMRAQVAFYDSTPTYRGVLVIEGREEAAERLHRLSVRGAWREMPALVDDGLLDAVCTSATWSDLPAALARRYRGRATRLMPYAASTAAPWGEIAAEVRRIAG